MFSLSVFLSTRITRRTKIYGNARIPIHATLYPLATCRIFLARRRYTRSLVTSAQDTENTNVEHARFIAEASKSDRWEDAAPDKGLGNGESSEDFESVTEGKGKLSPTSSHLFKLILPLGRARPNGEAPPPIVFLLHPSQPLSHVARLILASLAPATPTVSFRSTTPRGRVLQWADSTDVADFIRDASRARSFTVSISPSPFPSASPTTSKRPRTDKEEHPDTETHIPVEVPSFTDRTRFLRRRLARVEAELAQMETLKRTCDDAAHRGARRLAVGGFGMLLAYWGAVARLTFWDYGWDVMEPITYLSGLSMVILSYLWFLYRGREMSYPALLHHSVSARREALYKERGLDIDKWMDLMSEAKATKREISKIGEDYDERRDKDEEKAGEENEEREEVDDADSVEETRGRSVQDL